VKRVSANEDTRSHRSVARWAGHTAAGKRRFVRGQRRTLAGIVLVAAALSASCGTEGDGTPAGGSNESTVLEADLELGEQVYSANCATCHGSDGEGGFGPELADGRVAERYPDPHDHRAVVVNGRGAMPAWGDTLSDEEIDAVVRYERERLGQP
jgi:mono/diheme cytochrome c family protein